VRRGADRTAEGHLQLSGAAVAAPRRILYCGAVLIADRPRGVCPAELLDSIPAVGSSSQWPGCQDACLPSTAGLCPLLGVHQPGPPSGVQVSSRPVSSRPLSGYLAPSSGRSCPADSCPTRPASSRLVSARPPDGRSRLVPRPPGSGDGGRLGTAGQRSRLDQVESHVARPVPGSSVDGLRKHGCGHRCGGRMQAGGGAPVASAADLGRVVLRWEAAADRPGRPDRREGRPSQATALGQGGWLARCCRTAPCGPAIWPGAATTVRGRCDPDIRVDGARKDQTSSAARMACGPSAAQRGSKPPGPDAGHAVTCGVVLWARQGLNL
jgi:hypothetical protein